MPDGFLGTKRERVWRDGTTSSPADQFSFNGSTSQRTFLVDQAEYKQFAREALGYSEITGGRLRRHLPEFHPRFPHLTATRIVSTRGVRYDGQETLTDGKINKFKYVEVVLEYGLVNCDFISDAEIDLSGDTELARYVTYTAAPAAEHISLPTGVMQWADDPAGTVVKGVVPFGVGRVQYTLSLTYRWLQLPFQLLDAGGYLDTVIQQLLCTTNQEAFDGWPSGTLLLESAVPELQRFGDGTFCWDLTYKILYVPTGVNRLLRLVGTAPAQKLVPTLVSADGSYFAPGASVPNGLLLYDVRNFNRLFQVTD